MFPIIRCHFFRKTAFFAFSICIFNRLENFRKKNPDYRKFVRIIENKKNGQYQNFKISIFPESFHFAISGNFTELFCIIPNLENNRNNSVLFQIGNCWNTELFKNPVFL